MNIFIVGCGKIGSAFARERLQRGDNVWGLRRTKGESPDDVPAIPMLYAESAASTVAVFQQLDVQPDLICVSANPGLRGGGDNQILALVQSLVSAFPQARYLYTSSTFVYADAPEVLVDEEGPYSDSENARQLRAIEDAFTAATSSVILRLSAIVGPGREHLRKRIRDALAEESTEFAVRGPLDRRFNFIHEANVLELLHAFTDADKMGTISGVFNCSAPIDMSLRDYIDGLMLDLLQSLADGRNKMTLMEKGERMADRIVDSHKLQNYLQDKCIKFEWRSALSS